MSSPSQSQSSETRKVLSYSSQWITSDVCIEITHYAPTEKPKRSHDLIRDSIYFKQREIEKLELEESEITPETPEHFWPSTQDAPKKNRKRRVSCDLCDEDHDDDDQYATITIPVTPEDSKKIKKLNLSKNKV